MAKKTSTKVGKRGTVVIPADTRRRYRIDEGTVLIVAERDDGILLQPAAVVPVETYSLERKAEFLLSNAVDSADYARAVQEVRELGVDPDSIPHSKPANDERDGIWSVPTVFLDANVLFSAAYRPDAGLSRLRDLPDVELISSHYAAEEARRHLTASDQLARLENQGGARAKVKDVEILDATYEPLSSGTGFTTEARWNVAGSVGHWGHIHQRVNPLRRSG